MAEIHEDPGATARCGHVGRGRAVIVSAGRYFLELERGLAKYQRVHRQILLIAMQLQLEAVREKGLEHFRNLIGSGARRQLGVEIEAVAGNPIRPGNLVGLHAVGHRDIILEGEGGDARLRSVQMQAQVDDLLR